MFTGEKITRNKNKNLIKKIPVRKNLEILRNILVFEILEEHYYTPILFKQDTERFQHIIKKQSEIDFLHALKEYLTQDSNLLKDFDWWYFSKIDETIDRVGIPYFNSDKSQYDNFYPDFIFWLKKGNKYYIKFIDPHGVEYTTNSADKIDGFLDFVDDLDKLGRKKLEKVDLYYFNEQQPSREIKEEYRRYWTNDFARIFV